MTRRGRTRGPGDQLMRSSTAYFRLAQKASRAGNSAQYIAYMDRALKLKEQAWAQRDRAAARAEVAAEATKRYLEARKQAATEKEEQS